MEADVSAAPADDPAPGDELHRFCAAVLGDAGVQKRLAEPDDLETFVSLVLETAAQRGIRLSRDGVMAAIRDNRMAFMMRRIVR